MYIVCVVAACRSTFVAGRVTLSLGSVSADNTWLLSATIPALELARRYSNAVAISRIQKARGTLIKALKFRRRALTAHIHIIVTTEA